MHMRNGTWRLAGHPSAKMICALAAVVFLLLSASLSYAQSSTAALSGTAVDQTGATVAGVEITVMNTGTGLLRQATTNELGYFVIPLLPPGSYLIKASREGFNVVEIKGLDLHVGDQVNLPITLKVGPVSQTVTVEGGASLINDSPAVSTVVDQRFVKELPLNGRSFQTLFQLTPGIVITQTSYASQGQFSVNGQRSNSNYFTVDGTSANVDIAASFSPGQSFGGSLPALSAAGGTNSLVSTSAVQEFTIQTSTYAPEFGRTPGAQVSVVTKSGTNQFHGEAFEYLRNDVLDANDWFANRNGLKRAALRQNDFGGVLGGPLYKNKTFFFFSYEALRLRQPTTGLSDVPTLAVRNAAPAAIQPYLKAFPLPTGPDKASGLAAANYSFSNPSRLNATSVRVDHHFTQSLSIFGRYNYAPSEARVRGNSPSLTTTAITPFALHTLTLGMTFSLTPRVINEARFNWSKSFAGSSNVLDDFGGGIPLAPQNLFPASVDAQSSSFLLQISSGLSTTLQSGLNVANRQSQLNFIDSISWQVGTHALKFGIDYRRMTPRYAPATYTQTSAITDIPQALRMTSFTSTMSSNAPVNATYNNYSLYAQDTWRANRRLSLTYGLRWDYNPAPSGRGDNGLLPFPVQGFENLPSLALGPAGGPLYHANMNNFAPRLGFAYQLRGSARTASVIKGGAGIFYDLGNGPSGNVFANFPFQALKTISVAHPFPLTAADAAPPPMTTNPPYKIVAFPRILKLPYTYQWNLSFEQSLGPGQAVTVGYVGAVGHRLIRQDSYQGGNLPTTFTIVNYVNNAGASNYNAFQATFRRRVNKGLNVIAGYTLSHSLDNISTDAVLAVPGVLIDPRTEYGVSDFDIRHSATAGVDYDIPTVLSSGVGKAVLGIWAIDAVATSRSSPAVNVFVSRNFGFGTFSFRPDLISGAPLYINDPNAPGGRTINNVQTGPNTIGALSVPVAARQGNLPRNFFRGFPLLQLDLAIRRSFRLTEKVAIQARFEAFNILNHPNFSPEAGQLGTATAQGAFTLRSGFGVSQSMLGRGLQTGTFGSGFSPLYQIGGPRSLQLALKLEF